MIVTQSRKILLAITTKGKNKVGCRENRIGLLSKNGQLPKVEYVVWNFCNPINDIGL